MIIAVDAMGGDNAPFEVVKGVYEASSIINDVRILLVGDETKINECFGKLEVKKPENVDILHTDVFVTMVDVNKRAIGLCNVAIEKNNISNAKVLESNIYENITESYDLIISNPPIRAGKNVVHGIILGAYEHLNKGGSMWCVIQKKQGAESALKALRETYQTVEIITKDKGYYIIKGIK